jgi:hypothetical protein
MFDVSILYSTTSPLAYLWQMLAAEQDSVENSDLQM